MSHEVDETYGFYNEKKTRARKLHKCAACGEVIECGHVYYLVSFQWDGRVESLKRCVRCQAIHSHLQQVASDQGCWPAEKLDCGEDYEEHWGELPDEIAKLAFQTPGEAQKEETSK